MRTNISIFREYIKNSTNMRKEFEFIVFIPHKTLRIGFPILSLNLMQGHNWKTVFIGLISVFWIKFINVISIQWTVRSTNSLSRSWIENNIKCPCTNET